MFVPMKRRTVLGSLAASALATAVDRPARGQGRPVRIGVLGDFSSVGRANSGPGS